MSDKLSYEADYSYHLFMHGDTFNNILATFVQFRGNPHFTIPKRYKELVDITRFFYLRWEQTLTEIAQVESGMNEFQLDLYNEELRNIADLKQQYRNGLVDESSTYVQHQEIQKRIDKLLKKT